MSASVTHTTGKLPYAMVQQAMAYGRQQGVPVDAILAQAGLDLAPIAKDPGYMDLAKIEKILEALWRAQPGEPYPCLLDSQRVGRSLFGPITQLFLNAPSVGVAIQDLREFEGLFGNPGRVVITHQPGTLVIECRSGFTRPLVRANVADFLLGSLLLICGTIVTPEPLPLQGVTLMRPRPHNDADVALFNQAYGCEVQFAAEADALYFAPSVLSMRSSVSDGHAYQAMRQLFRQLVMAVVVPGAFSEVVRDIIRGMDGRTGISREAVAEKLGLSVRNLNRRLAGEGLSYLDVAEGVRYERAREYLAAGVAGLQDVAADLGFAESTSFSRWFKRVAGMTPSEFRERSAPGNTP